ncbi:MAG: porin [Paracoccaceae bacterium]|nr:porin [Paracoccaceae bacterium]
MAKPPQRPQEPAFYYGPAAHLLIATTALVATAGVAAADVKLSGYARFGAVYDDGITARAYSGATNAFTTNTNTDDVNTASRFRMNLDATTETDGGLTLGARVRMQGEENGNSGFNSARFTAAAGGLTVAIGNIQGVIEAAPNLYLPTKSAGVGLEGNYFAHLAPSFGTEAAAGLFGASTWTAYSSTGNSGRDGVEVIYSMNGIGLHVHSTDAAWGIGANYKFADYTVAAAYEDFETGENILFASLGGKFGAFDAALSYAKGELRSTRTRGSGTAATPSTGALAVANTVGAAGRTWEAEKFSLRGGYTVNDAVYVYGYYATESNNVAGVSVDDTYGLGASYALGGGASVEAGWEQNALGDNRVSAGIFFSF